MTLQADTLISDAVDQFQDEHQELALVYDEDEENVVGLISATDALEAVMGEIEDPLDIKLQERKSAPSELALRVQCRRNLHDLLFRVS
ncbi:CBS domain-containing protein [Halobellus inordinatus]|uniref:CBS domain-containing protein n=1 Tax=Halobellus inordinatus TaxID=1126236 RepID=UPI003CCCB90C